MRYFWCSASESFWKMGCGCSRTVEASVDEVSRSSDKTNRKESKETTLQNDNQKELEVLTGNAIYKHTGKDNRENYSKAKRERDQHLPQKPINSPEEAESNLFNVASSGKYFLLYCRRKLHAFWHRRNARHCKPAHILIFQRSHPETCTCFPCK
jgi:hypothetical protein